MAFDRLLDILKKVGVQYPALQQRVREAESLARWDIAVGAAIAKHTRPLRVQEKTLWVEVDHPIWQTELHHRKRQILIALNRDSNTPWVEDIFFVQSRSQNLDKNSSQKNTP
jgi:predicted nucleic acid-binding Zn ribbon protein